MKHIQEMLLKNAANAVSVTSNLNHVERGLSWDHKMWAKAHLEEALVGAAIGLALGGSLAELDQKFAQVVKELTLKRDVTALELGYIGGLKNAANVKRTFWTKAQSTPDVSILTEWVPGQAGAKGVSIGYDTPEEALRYLRENLTKDQMVFSAKASIMREMAGIISRAIADPEIKDETINHKRFQYGKRGDMKWGSVMGAIFWIGLAYKQAQGKIGEDGEDRSFESYVDWREARLNAELRKCADEQWEVGHYLIQEQEEIDQLRAMVTQHTLVAPYAKELFPHIDLWNKVEEWGYNPDSEFSKIILQKVPKDKSTEEKKRELEEIFSNLERGEQLKGYGGVSAYEELRKRADSLG